MSGLIVDLSLLIIILIFAIIGYFKGFLRELVSFFGFIGSLVITFFAYDYFAQFLNSMFNWGTVIANFVMEQVTAISPSFGVDTGASVEELNTIINSSSAGLAYKELLKQAVAKADFTGGALTVSGAVGAVVSGLVMIVISFALLFLVLRIVVFILDKLLSRIPRKSAVGVVNKWLGLGMGGIKGVISVGTIIVTVYLLCLVPSINDFVYPYIQSSYATKYVYEYLGQLVLGFSII